MAQASWWGGSGDAGCRRLWPHALLLGIVLVGAAWWAGAAGTVTVDEGIALVQAEELSDGTWTSDYPLADIDHDGSSFPLTAADRGEHGFVPYGKRPLYPMVLSLVVGWGAAGAAGLSVVGTVLAALAGGKIASQLAPDTGVVTVYALGLVSPLVFDSSLVLAHALAAACAGGAGVAAVRHHARGGALGLWLVPLGALTMAMVMLRSEGLLLAGAAVAVVGMAWVRARQASLLGIAAVVATGSALAVIADRSWRTTIFGDSPIVSFATVGGSASWLADQTNAWWVTMLGTYGAKGGPDLLLYGAAGSWVVASIAVRRQEPDRGAALLASTAAAAMTVAWVVAAADRPIPGLLLVFPLLWFGLAVGRLPSAPLAQVLLLVASLFSAGVWATQYRWGGGLEWGARYLAIVLPLIVPVAMLGLHHAAARLRDPRVRLVVGGALVVASMTFGLSAVLAQRRLNQRVEELADGIELVADGEGASPGDGAPVVVSADFVVPQITWALYDRYRWLLLRHADTDELGASHDVAALLRSGVSQFTFVSRDLVRDRALLGPDVVVSEDLGGAGGWSIVRVRFAPVQLGGDAGAGIEP